MGTPEHTCHAARCETPCPPRLLMCPGHWRMVPKAMQDAVYAAYRPGQGTRSIPSDDWFVAAFTAIAEVAEAEGFAKEAAQYRRRAERKAS